MNVFKSYVASLEEHFYELFPDDLLGVLSAASSGDDGEDAEETLP